MLFPISYILFFKSYYLSNLKFPHNFNSFTVREAVSSSPQARGFCRYQTFLITYSYHPWFTADW
jgi:hypothetical protein